MSVNLVQEFGPLIGVLVGGALSTGTAMLLHRSQRRDTLDAERRAREMAATSRIEDAVGALLVLERRPDELREIEEARRYIRGQNIDDLTAQPEQESLEKWDRWRDDLLLAFETASLDLSSEPLRARLEQAQRALLYPYGPWDIERQPESVTRRIVCRHALECVGAFRRGDLLPAKPKKFTGTIGSVDEWVGWQEEQIRFEKEEWAKRRKSHNSSAAPPE